MGESAGSGCVAHLLAAGDVPVAGAILPERRGRRRRSTPPRPSGWASSSSTPPGLRASADLASTSRSPRSSPRRSETVAGGAGQGRHDAVPPLGRRRPAVRARRHRAELPAVPLVVGTTAHEMELFRDQVPVLPDEVAVMFLAGKAANLGDHRRGAGCVPAFDACGGDLVEAVADLELHVPTSCSRAAHARGNAVCRYRFTWEAPVRRALSRARPAVHLRDARREHVARVRGRRRLAAAADALSARMQAALDRVRRRRRPGGRDHRHVARRRARAASATMRSDRGATTTSRSACALWLGDA